MQPADITAEPHPNTHPTLPWLDIQLQQRTAVESQVSPECQLDNFELVPPRKRHLAQRQCLPRDGTKLSTVPCNGRPFRVNHSVPWWHTGTAHWSCYQPGGTDTSRAFTPDLSKLESIAATSELFKHRDLDATLVVHATERKHDDRYNFYWYFTIPTLVAILMTIVLCNGYPYLCRKLLHKFYCTKQPVVNPALGKKSQSPPEFPPEGQPSTSQLQSDKNETRLDFFTYSAQTVAWDRDSPSTGQPRWERRGTASSSWYPSVQQKKNPERSVEGAALIYASVNCMFRKILRKILWLFEC
jgi:hypothetical protein